jgi:Zn-dependent membrane protease YugP
MGIRDPEIVGAAVRWGGRLAAWLAVVGLLAAAWWLPRLGAIAMWAAIVFGLVMALGGGGEAGGRRPPR